jgi:hypothetical protein
MLQRQDAVGADVPAEMSEEIRTRHAMYVPAMLVPYFLERRRTPQDALIAVHAQLVTEGMVDTFQPLIDWLHVAATVDGTAAIHNHP